MARKGLELLIPLIEAGMLHSNVRSRLSAAIEAAHAGTGKYGYYVDHTGDGESGDCQYMEGGNCYQAPYKLESVAGKNNDHVDMESAIKVHPEMNYRQVADNEDQ